MLPREKRETLRRFYTELFYKERVAAKLSSEAPVWTVPIFNATARFEPAPSSDAINHIRPAAVQFRVKFFDDQVAAIFANGLVIKAARRLARNDGLDLKLTPELVDQLDEYCVHPWIAGVHEDAA